MSGTLSDGDTGNPMATGTLWFTFVDIAFSTGTTLNAASCPEPRGSTAPEEPQTAPAHATPADGRGGLPYRFSRLGERGRCGVDLDGDGPEDVVIGAVSNDVQASGAGAAYVINGGRGEPRVPGQPPFSAAPPRDSLPA